MTMHKAVIAQPSALFTDRAMPSPRDDYILVQSIAVGLNPSDWKHVEFLVPPGVPVGYDYAGVLEAVGKNVKKSFNKGDFVWGFAHGSNAIEPEDRTFAEYIVVKGNLQSKIPGNLSFQEAATLGAGIHTACQGLYQILNMQWPTEPTKNAEPILIYGGSIATDPLAIQFAKLSGYTVITTCSPHNFDLVRALAADAVFDYKDSQAAAEIRRYTNNNLKLVFDCISLDSTAKFCDDAISTTGGEYAALLPFSIDRANVKSRFVLGYAVIGEAFKIGDMAFPAKLEDQALGKIKVHPPKVGKEGLMGILAGLELLKTGKVSGVKLVYNVSETP
ncbi:chaperonin 10-like protein [Aspergillus pseudonomiae]|nr:chaperonin 10-like protein [Aspergillus pseudonomiae]